MPPLTANWTGTKDSNCVSSFEPREVKSSPSSRKYVRKKHVILLRRRIRRVRGQRHRDKAVVCKRDSGVLGYKAVVSGIP